MANSAAVLSILFVLELHHEEAKRSSKRNCEAKAREETGVCQDAATDPYNSSADVCCYISPDMFLCVPENETRHDAVCLRIT